MKIVSDPRRKLSIEKSNKIGEYFVYWNEQKKQKEKQLKKINKNLKDITLEHYQTRRHMHDWQPIEIRMNDSYEKIQCKKCELIMESE